MSPQLEHDYIGLSELPTVENSDKLSSSSSSSATTPGELNCCGGRAPLNLKATELRLGPPGFESPGTIDGAGLTLGVPKSLASGAKRGFSDAIDGCGKWVFPGGTGSDVERGKGGALFSPRGGEGTGAGAGAGQRLCPPGRATDVGGAGQEWIAQNPSTGSERVGIAPPAKAQVVGWPPIRSYRKNTMAANPSKNKEEAEGKQGAGCIYVKVSMDGAPYLRKVDLKTYSNYKELSSALEKMFSCFTIGQCGTHGIPGRDVLSETRMTDLLHESEYVLAYEDKDGDWMLVGDVPWDMFTDSCRRLRIMKGSDAIGIAPRALEKRKNRN